MRAERLAELRKLQAQLAEHQGEDPLILPSVDRQAVASVVQDWTGIPVGRMVKNEIESVLQLAATLNKRIIGQDHAMEMIARRIQTSRAGLDNPSKPIGVFMLAGTSGVGKTETALALAEALYGGEQNVITINMSEYQEAHTVSSLKGAPPGYVGYGEGGVLTEAVRRRPYSVVLLDEVEKAHPDVHEIFFQVFDKGWMEDGEGRVIDFKNTLILLTTNAGSDLIMNLCKDPELMPEPEGIARRCASRYLKVFPPALLGRVVVIPYYPLSDAMLGAIIRLQLGRIERRVRAQHKIPFTYDDDVVKLIASRCTELESGGRMIDAILTNTLLPTHQRGVPRAHGGRAHGREGRHRRAGRRVHVRIRLSHAPRRYRHAATGHDGRDAAMLVRSRAVESRRAAGQSRDGRGAARREHHGSPADGEHHAVRHVHVAGQSDCCRRHRRRARRAHADAVHSRHPHAVGDRRADRAAREHAVARQCVEVHVQLGRRGDDRQPGDRQDHDPVSAP